MGEGYDALTDKEKEALRLMARGHDAKSMARHLSRSVHTVNDRLRAARRKLSVTSSREAARIVLEREGGGNAATPEKPAGKKIGDADGATGAQDGKRPGNPARLAIAGVCIVSILAAAALVLSSQFAASEPAEPASETSAARDEAVAAAARDWLELGDVNDWQGAFDAAGTSFREANTVAGWTAASRQVRVPLGDVLSRDLTGVRYLNAPPKGFQEVVFRTDFANRAGATETVTLVKEEGGWKVVGIMIE